MNIVVSRLKLGMLALIVGFLLLPACSLASSNFAVGRFFVRSDSSFWKSTFGIRHQFENGFTSNLSPWQLRVAKFFDLDVSSVPVLTISPENVDNKNQGEVDILARKFLPIKNNPWGVNFERSGFVFSNENQNDINPIVAVLDTGIDNTHPDLKNRIIECSDFTGDKEKIDNICDDNNGHGTHVAGIIAADGGADGLGILGVDPKASLLVYKVCNINGRCFADDVAFAIKTASDEGADIINLSLGSPIDSSLIRNAIQSAYAKGSLMIASAGNGGPYESSIEYPSAYPQVVSVSAMDENLNVPDWSSKGLNAQSVPYAIEEKDIEFVAPGVNIESTWKNGRYAIISGTSMAAPHISGLAALLWAGSSKETREYLRKISFDVDVPGDDSLTGFGTVRFTNQP